MGVSIGIGTRFGGEQVALEGVAFMDGHGAEVGLGDGQGDHHEDGQQGIEVIRNGGDEQGDAVGVALGGETGNSGCPGADGRDDADRSCGGVDQISQLGAGDVVGVSDGTHDGADGQAVEVVVYEDQHAQSDSGQLSAHTGLDVGGRPSAEGGGAAGVVHQGDQGAQDDQEDQDTHVGGVRQHRDHTVGCVIDFLEEDVVESTLEGEPGIEQGADDDTDEQGAVDFLGDQSQDDGDDRGEQSPEGCVHLHDFLSSFLVAKRK